MILCQWITFSNLYPKLNKKDIKFFCDQRANLTLDKMKILADAGAYGILPGIESFSSSILKLIDKGTKAYQNISAMRYARSCTVHLSWFLLYGLPNENVNEYDQYLTLLPKLFHLSPPVSFSETQIMRFGVYVKSPEENNISDLRPWPVYNKILPKNINVNQIAYYFNATFTSIVSKNPELVKYIQCLVDHWRKTVGNTKSTSRQN